MSDDQFYMDDVFLLDSFFSSRISFVNHCAALLAFSGVGLVFYFRDFQEPQNERYLLSCIKWTVGFHYKN